MSVQVIQDRLDQYSCRSTLEEEQALREISQEIVLAGLGRTDFFKKTAFQGGTCLRIFHGVNRFSEDLDFALLTTDEAFVLAPYLETLTRELNAYGYE
ncbi:MAG: nucleotidyl transferase AbiEii/AbiGii toxin family protein, partial [Planctomycetota bacterium]|nr:nucleotidyl transferase AbiEii/AbiGii toxin family protein [Planctomycetota bacterium]